MIILPDRNIPRPRFIVPVAKLAWMPSSQAERRDEFGRPVEVRRWYVAARVRGVEVWRGWFDDRDDWDTFLWSMASGGLQWDRYVQRLPHPWFDPDLLEDADIVWAATRSLTGTSASNQTDTVPSDWNSSSNFIATIASGGAGGACGVALGRVTGGSGAAWSRTNNVSLTPGGSATYRLSAGGAATAVGAFGTSAGNAGADCWYNGTTLAGSSVGAKGGLGGNANASVDQASVAGGAAASGIGSSKNSGGAAGASNGADSLPTASGGGGAATLGGNGVASGTADWGTNPVTNGGNSGSGAAGGGGSNGGTPGNGTAGTEYGSVGGGGGGGGLTSASSSPGGSGGNYGAGGGGAQTGGAGVTSGAGRGALIWFDYTPLTLMGQVVM